MIRLKNYVPLQYTNRFGVRLAILAWAEHIEARRTGPQGRLDLGPLFVYLLPRSRRADLNQSPANPSHSVCQLQHLEYTTMSYRQSMGAGFGGSQNRTPAPGTIKKKKQEDDFTLLLVRKNQSGAFPSTNKISFY